jgi:hypothetical protein
LKAYIDSAANCKPLNFLRCGGDELLVGRAGYLSGVLWLEKVFGKETFPAKDINELCKCIMESGRKYAQRHRSPCPLMFSYYDVEYLGQLTSVSYQPIWKGERHSMNFVFRLGLGEGLEHSLLSFLYTCDINKLLLTKLERSLLLER